MHGLQQPVWTAELLENSIVRLTEPFSPHPFSSKVLHIVKTRHPAQLLRKPLVCPMACFSAVSLPCSGTPNWPEPSQPVCLDDGWVWKNDGFLTTLKNQPSRPRWTGTYALLNMFNERDKKLVWQIFSAKHTQWIRPGHGWAAGSHFSTGYPHEESRRPYIQHMWSLYLLVLVFTRSQMDSAANPPNQMFRHGDSVVP